MIILYHCSYIHRTGEICGRGSKSERCYIHCKSLVYTPCKDCDWKVHKDVKEALHRHLFKDNQIEALVLDKRKKLTIKKRAQYCTKTKDVWDIWLYTLDLAVPKNNIEEAIVPASSRVSQFCRELAETGQLPNPSKTPKHFSLEKGLRRIQNINTTKIPTMQDLADVIIMLSMRPAEVATLCIIHYEPGELNPPEWYKSGYS
ncbi:hypothetical protein F8M41_023079 [Gigaspora margarita]|uniref:Uncharacterized protein n=1 Tax=Gigaspora margarita TaxID=4874 RepID=A0A8H4AE05_GIGMA|nr:hypothetical protein F8M41_023079 [Gigaspora margarita]